MHLYQLTNPAGTVTLAKSYASYGSGQSAYGYTGEQTDSTGMVYLRARYYSCHKIFPYFAMSPSKVPQPRAKQVGAHRTSTLRPLTLQSAWRRVSSGWANISSKTSWWRLIVQETPGSSSKTPPYPQSAFPPRHPPPLETARTRRCLPRPR